MTTTCKLLRIKRARGSPWPARLAEVARRLVKAYGLPTLGNYRDPVKEIFYILLSAKTTDAQYRATNRCLRATFPTLKALASAPVSAIRRCIESGGLARKRASQIKRTAKALVKLGGTDPSRFLRELDPEQAYSFLRELPGLGPKSALCVLMYSLGIDVLPVDANVQRVAERLGAVPTGLKHYQAQRTLIAVSPEGCSRELHIGMVVHGRRLCLPRNPKCISCPLLDLCRYGRKEVMADGR